MDSVLIVAHGRGDGDAFVHRHAEALQGIVGVPVRCAFRRHSDERVRPAMESIADSGARDLAVIPFFMTDNVYVRSIPKAMGLRDGGMEGVYERGGSRVSYRTTAPFGESPAFLEMMCQIAEGHPGASIVIVAAAHGSSPPPRAAGAALEALRSRGFEAAVCGSADAESVRRAGEGMSQIVAVPFTIGAAMDPIEGVTVTEPVGMDPRVPSTMARMLEGLRRPRGRPGTGPGGKRPRSPANPDPDTGPPRGTARTHRGSGSEAVRGSRPDCRTGWLQMRFRRRLAMCACPFAAPRIYVQILNIGHIFHRYLIP